MIYQAAPQLGRTKRTSEYIMRDIVHDVSKNTNTYTYKTQTHTQTKTQIQIPNTKMLYKEESRIYNAGHCARCKERPPPQRTFILYHDPHSHTQIFITSTCHQCTMPSKLTRFKSKKPQNIQDDGIAGINH